MTFSLYVQSACGSILQMRAPLKSSNRSRWLSLHALELGRVHVIHCYMEVWAVFRGKSWCVMPKTADSSCRSRDMFLHPNNKPVKLQRWNTKRPLHLHGVFFANYLHWNYWILCCKKATLYFFFQGQFFQTFAVQTNAERVSYPSPATATTPTTMTDKRIICVSQQQALFHKLNAN